MNIFVLDTDPAIAASMHCDQHLHKMILESAQMLSTAAHLLGYYSGKEPIYKPAHQNHPCSVWIRTSPRFAYWTYLLAKELDEIRQAQGCNPHSSMECIKACADMLELDLYSSYIDSNEFTFAGPDQIRLRPDLTIPQKYQAYYKLKYRQWLDTRHPMSYKGRPLPTFLQEFSESIPHG